MPTPPSNANSEFTETQTSLYDPTGHQFVAEKAYNVATDGTTNIVYGDPATGSGGGGGGGAVTDLNASGTISAAQPTQQSAVANATVVLTLGTGQSSFKAELVANAGFTSATTIVVDGSVDGTTWGTKAFKVSGSLTSTSVQGVVGPGPLEITGNCAGLTKVRIRCSVLNSGESITTTLTASVGTADVGLLSSIPTGTNKIGGVTIADGDAATIGTTTDAAYTSGSGTLVSVLKGIFTRLTLGSATSANSLPVVIASDQSGVTIKRTCTTIYSTTQTGISATADSGDIAVGQYAEISALINVTAFTGTNITFKVQAKDAFGNYYSVATGTAITAAGTQVLSVGTGVSTNTAFGATVRIQWVCNAVTSATFNLTAQAK